jgi:hypothetical protein
MAIQYQNANNPGHDLRVIEKVAFVSKKAAVLGLVQRREHTKQLILDWNKASGSRRRSASQASRTAR